MALVFDEKMVERMLMLCSLCINHAYTTCLKGYNIFNCPLLKQKISRWFDG